MKENLKEQLDAIEKHLKWCIDNNKPQEQLDVHTGVISDIKQEIETKMSKEEIEHLQWIHDRIISVYGESENVDFLIKMREIIKPKQRR